MSHSWPEISLQGLTDGDWWVREPSGQLRAGLLVWAHLPHVDLIPHRLWVDERFASRVHDRFEGRIEATSVREPRSTRTLPVAGLVDFPGEIYSVHRSKRRPAVVLTSPGEELPVKFRLGKGKWQVARTALVAPGYGVAENGTRAGWTAEFVARIQSVEYPQYHWDHLPSDLSKDGYGSIFRLDHAQPIGAHQHSYEPTGWALSPAALFRLRTVFDWLLSGGPTPIDAILAGDREVLMDAR